jgi:HD-GYP domain-containing protein (c-di-GMP phosphodiesterase class II)
MSESMERLSRVLEIGLEISQVKDVDVLLERILKEARNLTKADAGSIYIVEGNKLKFSYTQNDTMQKKLPPGKKMIYNTFSIPISNKSISGYVANTGEMLNIENAYEIPEDVPYSFDRQYDDISGYETISMLTFPLKTNRDKVTGVLQLINAMDADGNVVAFDKEDEPLIGHFANNAALALERAQMTRAIILRMIKMAELRDPKETGGHVNRVAAYAVEIYERWAQNRGLATDVIDQNKDILRMAAMLHDSGKIAIPDAILKKPGRLDPEEVAVMQQHTWLGSKLFADIYSEFDDASLVVALNHHERWDGKGYPGHINHLTGKTTPGYEEPDGKARGKKGEEIPAFGRVVAIADVYDALSCRRVYKEPWDESRVLSILEEEAGNQFDPDMVSAFFEILDTIRNIAARYPE